MLILKSVSGMDCIVSSELVRRGKNKNSLNNEGANMVTSFTK